VITKNAIREKIMSTAIKLINITSITKPARVDVIPRPNLKMSDIP